MLMETFVAIMALIAACVLQPGVYFAMNCPAGLIGTTPRRRPQAITQWGFVSRRTMLTQTAQDIGESTHPLPRRRRADAGRGHGADPLGAASAARHDGLLVPLRHPVRGAVHPHHRGRRHARGPLHDPGAARPGVPPLQADRSWAANLARHALCVAAWGYFLYQGVVDPLGGINTLWPLFGIANQMLAAIALIAGHRRAGQDEARALRLGDRAGRCGW